MIFELTERLERPFAVSVEPEVEQTNGVGRGIRVGRELPSRGVTKTEGV